MRVQARWSIGVAIFFLYAAWVFAVWSFRGVDYKAIGTETNLVLAIIEPLGLAALALAAFNHWAGWWRPTLVDDLQIRRPGLLILMLVPMLCVIGLGLASTDWTVISGRHLALLALAVAFVGFCEEMVTRGVLLVSLRGSLRSEAWAWFVSTALFGLLHATNAFFGIGAMALVQVLLAFCVGTGLYVLRRLSGSLLLPMLIHALWDFSSLAGGHAQPSMPAMKLALLACTDLMSLVLVWIVLRDRRLTQRSESLAAV